MAFSLLNQINPLIWGIISWDIWCSVAQLLAFCHTDPWVVGFYWVPPLPSFLFLHGVKSGANYLEKTKNRKITPFCHCPLKNTAALLLCCVHCPVCWDLSVLKYCFQGRMVSTIPFQVAVREDTGSCLLQTSAEGTSHPCAPSHHLLPCPHCTGIWIHHSIHLSPWCHQEFGL